MEKDFIPVSKNLLNDPKVKALQMKYGKAAGVGHWVIMLLEMYQHSKPSIETGIDYLAFSLMDDHGMDEEGLDELCRLCADLTLIEKPLWYDYRCISNPHVNEHKADMDAMREKRAEAGRRSGESRRSKA